MIDTRPSPDALLKAAKREGRGRLKILLGAAPGVGKTVEMLREGADLLLRGGTDVVIGVVETHGRAGTAALVTPFEILPRRTVEHEGHVLDEFDLDAMLARRPGVALIDELAHTNAPGSRHPKRWQDVEELRDAGIDVMTTVNIQHVESLNDVVAGFTHVRVRETVPDAVLEDAEIEVVDLPPDELIARLKAGEIYRPDEAGRALQHFFVKSKLSALRELALRRAAQTVDRQMLDGLRAAGDAGLYAGAERIVVAVGDQPGAEALVRAAKRLADAFGASWTAVSIETPRTAVLGPQAQASIAGALQLATTLGATIATVPAADVISGLRAHMTETRATALVIGKSRRSWWFEKRHGSVVDQLVRGLDGAAVYVVPTVGAATVDEAFARRRSPMQGVAAGLVAVAAITVFAHLLAELIGPNAVDLLYLIPVVAAATLYGLRPALATSVASALAYNFFFLPPVGTLSIDDPQNIVTFLVLTGVGVVASELAGRLKRQATVGVRAASENAALAAFGQRLSVASDKESTAAAVCEEIGRVLDVSTVTLSQVDGRLTVTSAWPDVPTLGPLDIAAADWAFAHEQVTGQNTVTLAAGDWQFHPLSTALGVLGVLGLSRANGGAPVPSEQQLLLTTMKGQAALAHERLKLEADAREVASLRQRDDLRAALLSSIGHDLKTPLSAVVAAADALAATTPPSEALTTLGEEARRLRRFFNDLIEMTRIEAGALSPRIEAVDLTDAVAAAAHDLRAEMGSRKLVIDVPTELPLISADARLLHHVLINLVGNAAKFAPDGSTITLRGVQGSGGVTLSVVDQGPGLPAGDPALLFERFTRGEGGDRTGGTGLGLAIVKGFAGAMGVAVTAKDGDAGGAVFSLEWPSALVRSTAP